jgi:hypothetical protein
MPEFKLNQEIVQKEPVVKVDVTPNTPLPLGANRFRLVVVDDAGNESEPTFLDVVVRDLERPTAVLDVVNSDLKRIDPVVVRGQGFILSGARSADLPPGAIVEYRFTLVDRG